MVWLRLYARSAAVTLAELEKALAGRRVARINGVCLFTVYTADEADEWKPRGARGGQHSSGAALVWEVQPAYCLPEQPELNDDGESVDTRPAFLLNYLRERDGYSKPTASWQHNG